MPPSNAVVFDDIVFDAIVIGAGIAGCASANRLAARGLKVALLDAQTEIASGASGNPIAMLYPKLGAMLTSQMQLSLAGFAFSTAQIGVLLAQNDYDFCGLLQLAFNEKNLIQLNKIKLQTIDFNQINIEFLNETQASDLANLALKYPAFYFNQAGWVKPKQWCLALAKHANITFFGNSKVLSMCQTGAHWQLKTAEQTFLAAQVIVCNAHDASALLPALSNALTPVRGQLNWSQVVSTQPKKVVCDDHFVSPPIENWQYFGTTFHANDLDAHVRAKDSQQNLAAAQRLLPASHLNAETLAGRVGWRCQTPDYLPLAGQMLDLNHLNNQPPRPSAEAASLPWLAGLYVNIGHGAKGMTTAPICAEWIAQQICNEPFERALYAKLQPNRFALRQLDLKRLAGEINPARI